MQTGLLEIPYDACAVLTGRDALLLKRIHLDAVDDALVFLEAVFELRHHDAALGGQSHVHHPHPHLAVTAAADDVLTTAGDAQRSDPAVHRILDFVHYLSTLRGKYNDFTITPTYE